MNDERIRLFRSVGPYLPGNGRLIIDPSEFEYDIKNDGILNGGGGSFTKWGDKRENRTMDYKGYFITILFRRAKRVSNHWVIPSAGYLYESIAYIMRNDGKVTGHRSFFVLSSNGKIHPCYQRAHRLNPVTGVAEYATSSFTEMEDIAYCASTAMQFSADKKYCWTITAKEKAAKATLGCAQEEIKSLLYARDLPLTSTGRKKPILHLVAAHKRRIKNGTDIDIVNFLRGSQVVHIGGTEFTVTPPTSEKINLPKSHRFFEHQEKTYSADIFSP